jgi:polysaccharide pyruvyl transferase WcaK-like protein
LNILILHGYSDSNKGDLAIVVGMVKGILLVRPDSKLTLQSVYSELDPDFDFHHRFVKRLGLNVHQMAIPSPYVDTASHSAFRNVSALLNLLKSTLAEWCVRRLPPLSGLFPRQRRAVLAIKHADVVLLKGGQYIYNDQGGLRALLYLWRILHPIFVAHDLGRPVVMLGQSVGPLVDARGRKMTRNALGLCRRLIVREQKSEALLHELGLDSTVVRAPDFAFLIEPCKPERFGDVLEKLIQGQWLGVTVVNWSFPDSTDPHARREAYLDALFETTVSIARKHGLGIALFPQVTVQHHGESDLDLLNRLAERLESVGVPYFLVRDDLAPEELSYLYGMCRVLLGTRLHSCILAACAACPVVAIRYQGFKTEGVMAELGLENRVFDIANVQASELVPAIEESLARRNEISADIAIRVGKFRGELITHLKQVLA